MAKHAQRAHALLSASGAERWFNCTPSAVFEERFPRKSSKAADEGTLAHEMSELILRRSLGIITETKFSKELDKLKAHELHYDEMEEDVRLYTDLVLENLHGYESECKVVDYAIEEKIDLTKYIQDGFGTADFRILADDTLHIIDLKFGKGTPVSAYKNKQLMIYALGALEFYSAFTEITTVRMTIIQPRLEKVSAYEITAQELLDFGKDVEERAKIAYNGEGEFESGDHCKYCKGKHRCKAFAEQQLKTAKADFALDPENVNAPTLHDLNMLSDEELVNIHLASKNISKWLDEVKDYLIVEAEAGREWQGLKLIDGKSVRYWLSEADAIAELEKHGLQEDQIIKKSLQGITAVEKLLGKLRFAEVEKGVVGRKNQAKQLVRADIKNIEKQTAKNAFAD